MGHPANVGVIFRVFFFFKQKTAYEMSVSDWSSDVCSSDLVPLGLIHRPGAARRAHVVRASGGGTYEPAGNAGGRFTRVRGHVPRCPGHHYATGDRVTLVVPGPGPPPAQLERRAAPGHRTERRRGGDQFLSRIPGRALSEPVR